MWYHKMKETLYQLKDIETQYQGMILENLSDLSKSSDYYAIFLLSYIYIGYAYPLDIFFAYSLNIYLIIHIFIEYHIYIYNKYIL